MTEAEHKQDLLVRLLQSNVTLLVDNLAKAAAQIDALSAEIADLKKPKAEPAPAQ